MEFYDSHLYPIVYLDESGFKSDTFRPKAYAKRGQTCTGVFDWNLKQTNVIGAACNGVPFAFGMFECSVNSDVFHAWITQALIPELPARSVVVMDNATFHKRQDILGALKEAGHIVLWLPPYSPDLNPIEKTWAWIKKIRREWRISCVETLLFWFLNLV